MLLSSSSCSSPSSPSSHGHIIALPGSAHDGYTRSGFKRPQEPELEEGQYQTGGAMQDDVPDCPPYFPTSDPMVPMVIQDNIGTISHEDIPPVISRDDLRAYILTHSLKGTKMAKERSKFIGEVTPFTSPTDKEVSFGLRRFNNDAILKYRDLDAAVRYTYQEGEDKVTTEKDYPMGTRRLDVVMLGLVSWNITDNGQAIPISRQSVLDYLDPDGELDAVYEKIMELNPVLTGQARKNS